MFRTSTRFALVLLAVLLATVPAAAQDDNDALLKLAEPDFTLVGLPTSLRLPQLGSSFRVTHRFARPLSCDGCEDNLLEDLFGLDAGAVIGLEYRLGLVPNGYVGFRRTRALKTIELFGQYGLARQTDRMPVEISVLGGVEGTDNFRDEYSSALGFIASRLFGEGAAIHVEPMWVGNSNVDSDIGDDSTFVVGLGTRVRVRPTVYLVAEVVPRVSGFDPGVSHKSFAIEKRAGGHLFQLNFSNSFSTSTGQLVRGGDDNDSWYLGFNISRKFY